MSGSKGKDESAILRYLTEQNRPYSVNDILLNMKKEVGKTGIQKALDKLVQDEKVREKVYGKQKVYLVNQMDLGESTPDELKAMDTKIEELEKVIQESENSIKIGNTELKDILSKPTTKVAKEDVERHTEEVRVMDIKHKKLAEKVVCVDAKERLRIREDRSKAIREWKIRKRLATEMTDNILENYPKDKKCLYEDMKIETDEDAGVVVPLAI